MFQSIRKRNRDRRSRQNFENSHSSKPLQHAIKLAKGSPYLIDCPKLPPTLAAVTTVTRTVEMIVVGTTDTGSQYPELVYGNAGTPCYAKIDITDNNHSATSNNRRFEFGLTLSDLCKLLASRFSRSAVSNKLPEAQILPYDIFSYVRLDRVRAWGPTGTDIIGYPIQLTVYNIQANSLKSGTYTVLGVCSERVIGNQHSRASLAIANPGPYVPVALDFAIGPQMHAVQIVIGYNVFEGGTNYQESISEGDVLAVLHLTVSAQCGRDTTSLLLPKVYDGDDTSSTSSGFAMVD